MITIKNSKTKEHCLTLLHNTNITKGETELHKKSSKEHKVWTLSLILIHFNIGSVSHVNDFYPYGTIRLLLFSVSIETKTLKTNFFCYNCVY